MLLKLWLSVGRGNHGGEVVDTGNRAKHDISPCSQNLLSCHRHNHNDRSTLLNATRESEEHLQVQNRGRAHPPSQQAAGEVRMMNEKGSRSQAANAAQASGQAAPLLAIIYSEFDNTLGPTIRCQAPEGCVCLVCVSLRVSFVSLPSRLLHHAFHPNRPPVHSFLSQDFFDSISDYVITGRQLYGRTIAVTACDLQVVGFPLCIENEKVRPFLRLILSPSLSTCPLTHPFPPASVLRNSTPAIHFFSTSALSCAPMRTPPRTSLFFGSWPLPSIPWR